MSDSKRRAFYRWYLLERNNPGEARGRLMVADTAEEWDWRSVTGTSGVKYRKRNYGNIRFMKIDWRLDNGRGGGGVLYDEEILSGMRTTTAC